MMRLHDSAAELGEAKPGRTVRLPFDYGQIVYHRARVEKVPGMVTGFNFRASQMWVQVTWGDNLTVDTHCFYELTTEYEAFREDS
jgi:hypothetical protein